MRLRGLLAPLLVASLAGGPAAAMQVQLQTAKDGSLFITARGEIHSGDTGLVRQALAAVPAGKHVLAVIVDSPGGNLVEGEKLAALIHDSNLGVFITSESQCASACFLLLAGSPRRVVGTNALVGVHSASIEGKETVDSMAMTLLMQRVAGSYGVPPAIIGKMAQTTPGRIEWLTHDDLAAMDVKIVDDILDAGVAAPAPVVTPPRQATPRPRLAPAPLHPAQAEFQGALFCRQGTAKLSLRVVDSAGDGIRKAVFSFSPMAASNQQSSGSFLMEGRLDLTGGGIELRPTQWVSAQPSDFTMVGLSGHSADGGKTFSGRVLASTSCTVFTLKRTY